MQQQRAQQHGSNRNSSGSGGSSSGNVGNNSSISNSNSISIRYEAVDGCWFEGMYYPVERKEGSTLSEAITYPVFSR